MHVFIYVAITSFIKQKAGKMSLLNEYMQKEKLLEQLQKELQEMEGRQELTKELEFKHKLQDLLTEHKKNEEEVIEMLDPDGKIRGLDKQEEEQKPGQRKKRKEKTYINPHSGEKVVTRGGNQKTLKQWREEYGHDEVESWLQADS